MKEYVPSRVVHVSDLLDQIGWTPLNAASQSGVAVRTWRRWKADPNIMPNHVYAWLYTLATLHRQNPFPSGVRQSTP
jgi:hypothetical protein